MRRSASTGHALASTQGMVPVISGLGAVGIGVETAPSGVGMFVFGLVLIVASILERWRYRAED